MEKYSKIPRLTVEIRNEAEGMAEIDIDGDIGGWNGDLEDPKFNTTSTIKNQLKKIAEMDVSKIVVNINSLGGFVDDGLAIHDVLAQHKAEITTKTYGMTASAATIIAQAGDKRLMSENSLYLVHRAMGFAFGNINEIIAAAEDLETVDNRISNLYAKRSGKDKKAFEELMNANNGSGKWLDAEEAMEIGLIDEVFEPMKAAAFVDKATFQNMHLPVPENFGFLKVENETQNTYTITTTDNNTGALTIDFGNKMVSVLGEKPGDQKAKTEKPIYIDSHLKELELLINE